MKVAERTSQRSFRPDIQGLRALAIVLVLLDHAGVPRVAGGFVGVDVFFVISGFLISGHLMSELSRSGRIELLRFFGARTRRILPAAVLTIASTACVAFFVVSPLRIEEILRDGIASALSVPNLLFAVKQTDYLAGTAPSPFQHLWSLGVEEQFYLAWPLILLFIFIVGRRSRRVMAVAIITIAVASFTASVVTTADAPSLAFFSPHTRAWEFAVGALIAAGAPALARAPAAVAHGAAWIGLAAILAAAIGYSADTAYPGTAALLPVLGSALVLGFGNRGARGTDALLTLPPVQFLGMISYSLYLVHWPILVLSNEQRGLEHSLPVNMALLLSLLSVPLAWLMYRYVEARFRVTSATTTPSPRRMLAASTAVCLVLTGSLVAATAAAATLPLTAERVESSVAPTPLPLGTSFVPRNISPTLADATRDTGEIYASGCQQNLTAAEVVTCEFGAVDSPRSIALFGDSHAGRWFPALEEAATGLGYRLDTYTKSGCRSEETVAVWDAAEDAACSSWRNDVVAVLRADPPEVIVLANHLGPRPDKDFATQYSAWSAGLERLYDRLPSSSFIVTLADTPEFSSSPVLCLSSHLNDASHCSVARDAALNPAIRAAQHAATQKRGAAVIDLTDYFCNRLDCPAIIGTQLVYSDEHHLTATFSAALAPALQEELTPYLAPAPHQ